MQREEILYMFSFLIRVAFTKIIEHIRVYVVLEIPTCNFQSTLIRNAKCMAQNEISRNLIHLVVHAVVAVAHLGNIFTFGIHTGTFCTVGNQIQEHIVFLRLFCNVLENIDTVALQRVHHAGKLIPKDYQTVGYAFFGYFLLNVHQPITDIVACQISLVRSKSFFQM